MEEKQSAIDRLVAINDEIKSTSSSVTDKYQQLKKQFEEKQNELGTAIEELKTSNNTYQQLKENWKKSKAQSID